MNDLVRLMSAVHGSADPATVAAGSDALVRQRASAQAISVSKPSLDSTLAFVERAAETLRTLQRDNDMANRQLGVLREQLQRERLDRQADSEKFDQFVKDTHRKVTSSEAQAAEAKALAVAAIKRCEEMAASEAKAVQFAKASEARAVEAEDCLLGLQKAIVFEFSSVLP